MPASATLMPARFSVPTISSRFARVSSMRNPRSPSLPPNSTTATAGCSARISGSRSTPSFVVLPLTPWFTTR